MINLKLGSRAFGTAMLLVQLLLSFDAIDAQETRKNYIPSSAIIAVVARPADAIAQPSMELFPREIVSTMGPKELGFDPCEIARFTTVVDTVVDLDQPPGFGIVMEFDTPQKIGAKLIAQMNEYQSAGVTVYGYQRENEPVLAQLDEKTIVFATEPFLAKMLNANGAKSELITLIDQQPKTDHVGVFMVMEPVRALLKQNLPQADQVPPMFKDFLKIPDLVESAVVSGDFSETSKLALSLNAISPAAANELNGIFSDAITMGQQVAMMQIAESMRNEDPDLQRSTAAYMERVFGFIRRNIKPEMSQNGQSLVFSSEEDAAISVATIGILTGMLLPAVQQVREAARRTVSMNNLRQFALASHNYESAFQKFPAHALYSRDGKPLLSWRVTILPYIDEQELHDQFHLDEPWDSEHNIKLLDKMPEIFRCPNSIHTNKTVYLAADCRTDNGSRTAMNGTQKGTTLGSISDGTSNTILFVEVDDEFAQPWSKPADLKLDLENPMNGLGNLRPGGFNAALCDGSVHFISNSIDREVLKNLFLINDGNLVDF